MTAIAKIFMHGHSQAVRLPKEFRFAGKEVRVSKDGDRVILEPIARTRQNIEAAFARIDQLLAGDEYLPGGVPDDPPLQPDPRRFFDE